MATLTGYYRYTDIWFKWFEAIPGPDGPKVKCVLAHDALVDINHPLHPGVPEAELYMGILPSGESRLLFSSKQIDYLRYWLHAMEITKQRVPLPYSNCLLLADELKTVSPVYFKTGGDLKKAIKEIEKNNKRLKNSSGGLASRRVIFEKVRRLWSQRKGAWLAIDFEEWEIDHHLKTELGMSSIYWDGATEVVEDHHYMISESGYRNGQYVEDNRMNYDFGESKVVPMQDFKKILTATFNRLGQYGAVFLVFHDASGDIKTLEELNAPIQALSDCLPDNVPISGMFKIDTTDMFGALIGDESKDKQKLQRICHHLGISRLIHFHNAGNDAHFTMAALKAMASGAPLDVQREERWPKHTGVRGGVSVEFTEEEEELDNDMELYYA